MKSPTSKSPTRKTTSTLHKTTNPIQTFTNSVALSKNSQSQTFSPVSKTFTKAHIIKRVTSTVKAHIFLKPATSYTKDNSTMVKSMVSASCALKTPSITSFPSFMKAISGTLKSTELEHTFIVTRTTFTEANG